MRRFAEKLFRSKRARIISAVLIVGLASKVAWEQVHTSNTWHFHFFNGTAFYFPPCVSRPDGWSRAILPFLPLIDKEDLEVGLLKVSIQDFERDGGCENAPSISDHDIKPILHKWAWIIRKEKGHNPVIHSVNEGIPTELKLGRLVRGEKLDFGLEEFIEDDDPKSISYLPYVEYAEPVHFSCPRRFPRSCYGLMDRDLYTIRFHFSRQNLKHWREITRRTGAFMDLAEKRAIEELGRLGGE